MRGVDDNRDSAVAHAFPGTAVRRLQARFDARNSGTSRALTRTFVAAPDPDASLASAWPLLAPAPTAIPVQPGPSSGYAVLGPDHFHAAAIGLYLVLRRDREARLAGPTHSRDDTRRSAAPTSDTRDRGPSRDERDIIQQPDDAQLLRPPAGRRATVATNDRPVP